jgi:DNA-directed RNA polymerase omega subunit
MGYQPIEKLLPKSGGSIYKLILLAARRATELADGRPRLIDFPSTLKVTTIALEEIMEGRVVTKGSEKELAPAPEAAKKEEPKKKE